MISSREGHGMWLPPVDVYENGNAWIVHMELPGVDIEELDLIVTHDTLQVSGEKRIPTGKLSALRMEIYTGPFRRELHFPDTIDVNAVTASMEAGILTMRLPRSGSTRVTIPIEPLEER